MAAKALIVKRMSMAQYYPDNMTRYGIKRVLRIIILLQFSFHFKERHATTEITHAVDKPHMSYTLEHVARLKITDHRHLINWGPCTVLSRGSQVNY